MYKIIGADGKEYGPATAEALRQWITEGRANAQTRVLPEGTTEWKTLGELPEFAAALAGQAAPLPTLTPLPSSTAPKTNSLAVAGLVLGLLSVTCGLCCYGLPFNLAGVICSGMALAQLKREPAQQGRGLAIAGLVLSILSILLAVFMTFAHIALNGSDLMRRIQKL